MDVKVIRSGRNKIQLLVEGFRYYRTKGPMGVDETCYFLCIVEGCKARAATSGPISTEEVNVKYHNRPTHPHNHPPNFADNVNAEILHEFRTAGRNEPHQLSKSLHKNSVLEKLQAKDTPEREEIAAHLDPHEKIRKQYSRITADNNPKFNTVEEVNISAYANAQEDVTKTSFGKPLYRGKTKSHF